MQLSMLTDMKVATEPKAKSEWHIQGRFTPD